MTNRMLPATGVCRGCDQAPNKAASPAPVFFSGLPTIAASAAGAPIAGANLMSLGQRSQRLAVAFRVSQRAALEGAGMPVRIRQRFSSVQGQPKNDLADLTDAQRRALLAPPGALPTLHIAIQWAAAKSCGLSRAGLGMCVGTLPWEWAFAPRDVSAPTITSDR